MTEIASLKQRAVATIDARRVQLIQLSQTIFENPELAFREFNASALLCDTLQANGFVVERGIGGLETAFRAEARGASDGATIAFLAEYDALPDLGHACGHNLIAAAAVGAGLAVRACLGELAGRIVVIGTPAEESGGGKIILLERGVFADVDAALMTHPSNRTTAARTSLASLGLQLEFRGKAAHAAAAPHDGINALEAVIQTFVGVNALRLHLPNDARVHGIITHGGTAPNIIPEYAAAMFSIRAATLDHANAVVARVVECARGGATATGARLEQRLTKSLAHVIPNRVVASLLEDNWRALGVSVDDPGTSERMGSTDMGNITHALPAVHAYIAIAPPGVAGHSIEFRDAAISERGQQGMLNAAKGMALTALDLLSDAELLRVAKIEFQKETHQQ